MIESFGATDTGQQRPLNEDSLLIDGETDLYVVADGMGGHNAGDLASRIAVDVIARFIRRTHGAEEFSWPHGYDVKLSPHANRLRTAVMLANRKIWKEAETRDEYTGMGSTIVAVVADADILAVCSAGDSRSYRIRDGNLRQVTTDDSWVQTALSGGLLEQDQARNHPMKNLITKALGARETIELDAFEAPLQEGDVYLLCSDGLHGLVRDSSILEIVKTAGDDLEGGVRGLILKQARSRHASRRKRDDAGPSLTRRRAGVPVGFGCSR